ncbi:MAG: pinensin family lanthipeptide [Ignavibacteria bacterium]|nr:pinensin family lanthipeptide [Ignavibacteria bacterium]
MNRKKMKFNVDDLKVQSFVTSLNSEEKFSLNGGSDDQYSVLHETKVTCTCIYTCGSGQCSVQSGQCC